MRSKSSGILVKNKKSREKTQTQFEINTRVINEVFYTENHKEAVGVILKPNRVITLNNG